jgi:hypothetical protein
MDQDMATGCRRNPKRYFKIYVMHNIGGIEEYEKILLAKKKSKAIQSRRKSNLKEYRTEKEFLQPFSHLFAIFPDKKTILERFS